MRPEECKSLFHEGYDEYLKRLVSLNADVSLRYLRGVNDSAHAFEFKPNSTSYLKNESVELADRITKRLIRDTSLTYFKKFDSVYLKD